MLLNQALVLPGFDATRLPGSKYLFFTGKGGVGKTSTACAVAVAFADTGKKVLLVSTDPASNLQDVFDMALNGTGTSIPQVPGLVVVNLNPEEAAAKYRNSVLAPYIGKLPASVVENMEEQLSGSCTVEIAAFDQFSKFITDEGISAQYDRIIFDTAPTGHTLRMLQLPSAWSNFISESTHGASCLGQLSGLQEKKDIYRQAVTNLADSDETALILVSRPEAVSLAEASRSSAELLSLGIRNQLVVINGVLERGTDSLSRLMFAQQQAALEGMPSDLRQYPSFSISLRHYNVLGVENLRSFFRNQAAPDGTDALPFPEVSSLDDLISDLVTTKKKVIFTMGKGGVGKTTVAASIAQGLANQGLSVLLTTTDPANHLKYRKDLPDTIEVSSIDEKAELQRYQDEVMAKARMTMNTNDLSYVEEDLRSPCTQEIAVFRAFAEIIERSNNQVVVIDTAPTGHTLLLLDSTQSYHKEVQRTKGETPVAVQNLLPRLRDANQTEVVIVTLPEATPVFEATRLKEDLERAGIRNGWWVVNQSMALTDTTDPLLRSRAQAEIPWVRQVVTTSRARCAVIPLNLRHQE
ncbi:MAG: arsenical pump-driving ATPase [Spirochaetales bacterium]|nr:arsenical pump-driving ATPase [Spirochaetales bacterium]